MCDIDACVALLVTARGDLTADVRDDGSRLVAIAECAYLCGNATSSCGGGGRQCEVMHRLHAAYGGVYVPWRL